MEGQLNEDTNQPTATCTTTGEPDHGRCSLRVCRIRGEEKYRCAAPQCDRVLHLECYEQHVMAKYDLNPLPGSNFNVACTKFHHKLATRDLSAPGGGDERAEGIRKGNWECDGKRGADDPHTSMKILLDWWMEEGNYARFCGKKNDGLRKIQFCANLATKISSETTVTRDSKSVLNKIQHIERSFKEAHTFAESETGAGIKEKDGEANFQDLVKKKCPFYYDIYDVMIDRASTRAKTTNYELDDDDDDEDEIIIAAVDEGNQNHNNPTLQPETPFANRGTPTSVGGMSGVTEMDADGENTTAQSTTSASKAKKRKKSSWIDDDAASLLTAANDRSTAKMNEMVRHHKILESMEEKKLKHDDAKLQLDKRKEEREERLANLDIWKGKSAELDYKMSLLKQYQEMKDNLKWTDQQILDYCPDMEQVIKSSNK